MEAVDNVTRRLLGRYLATIDNVVGIAGRSPAVVITWSDTTANTELLYDSGSEYGYALSDAREIVKANAFRYDIVDNTL